ncbi:hypothetical protein AQUCO_10800011v1 [Aquilegia coerulea]|uniref:Uncharacterized protein n=1 Tax=Aquilegia coerulea TaxID=218851 RepID=A0A2G5C3A3_AQUCA|nr:hypothetical protein AQUCO_10800011v1 [Aquilegia coerulea]
MKSKNKKSANSIEDLLEFQKSKLPRLMNCLDSRVSRESSETSKAKRVRFEDTDTLHPLTCNPNASGNLPPKSEDPKTSEFALYRKFHEDTGHSFRSYQHHKQDKQLEKSDTCNHTKEVTKRFKLNHAITSLSPKENVTPLALVQPLPPQVSMNSDKAFGLSSRSNYKELDDLRFSNELASDRERCTQFPGWDTNSIEKVQDFFTSCGAAPNTCSTWRMPSEDNLPSLNCILDASSMHSPSSHGIYHCSDITLQNMSSDSDIIDAIGRQSPVETEYQVEEADEFPLTLCCTPRYIRLEERCRLSSLMEETSIFHSPLTKSIFMRRIFRERLTPSLGTPLQSIPEIDDVSDDFQACDYIKELQLSICSDLQVPEMDTRSSSTFLLAGDTDMDSLSNTEDQIQLAEDSCFYDLTSLTLKIPINKFNPWYLDESGRYGSGEIVWGDDSRQFLLMDSSV